MQTVVDVAKCSANAADFPELAPKRNGDEGMRGQP